MHTLARHTRFDVAFLVLLPIAPLAAQQRGTASAQRRDTTAASMPARDSAGADVMVPRPRWRDPALAAALGVLHPGLGHYYAGEYEKGFRIEATTLGAAMGVLLLQMDAWGGAGSPEPSRSRQRLDDVGTVLAGTVALGAWIYGAVDAPRAARREDRLRGLAMRTPNERLAPPALFAGVTKSRDDSSVGTPWAPVPDARAHDGALEPR